MGKRVFVAGATGVIGRRLVQLLVQAGHEVTGLTRNERGTQTLNRLGVAVHLADVFDREALSKAVREARPEILIHQLTDLGNGFDPKRIAETLKRNARIRITGTANLLAASQEAGVGRMVAQSIAFIYAPGPLPYDEDAPLDQTPGGVMEETVRAVLSLESQVRTAYPGSHVILRYGNLYGPGTGNDAPISSTSVHVDAAAFAALLAVDHGHGVYNIADNPADATSERAKRELDWQPEFREAVEA